MNINSNPNIRMRHNSQYSILTKEEQFMALVKCPKCGRTISDTALKCPGCDFALPNEKETMNICIECGTIIPPGSDSCPNCGSPADLKQRLEAEEAKEIQTRMNSIYKKKAISNRVSSIIQFIPYVIILVKYCIDRQSDFENATIGGFPLFDVILLHSLVSVALLCGTIGKSLTGIRLTGLIVGVLIALGIVFVSPLDWNDDFSTLFNRYIVIEIINLGYILYLFINLLKPTKQVLLSDESISSQEPQSKDQSSNQ